MLDFMLDTAHSFFRVDPCSMASIWPSRMNTALPTFSRSSRPFSIQLRTVLGEHPKASATCAMRKRRCRTPAGDVADTASFDVTARADLAAARRRGPVETAFTRLPGEVVRTRPGLSGLPLISSHGILRRVGGRKTLLAWQS